MPVIAMPPPFVAELPLTKLDSSVKRALDVDAAAVVGGVVGDHGAIERQRLRGVIEAAACTCAGWAYRRRICYRGRRRRPTPPGASRYLRLGIALIECGVIEWTVPFSMYMPPPKPGPPLPPSPPAPPLPVNVEPAVVIFDAAEPACAHPHRPRRRNLWFWPRGLVELRVTTPA